MSANDPSETLAAKFAVMHKRRRPPECDSLSSPEPQKEGKPHEAPRVHRRSSWGADPPGGDRAACSDWTTTDSS
jgi:hypothetical protein